jgi:hypothetical protein
MFGQGCYTVHLSIFLNKALALDLKEISSPNLRDTTMIDGIIRATDKGFSLNTNYPKGDSDRFQHWLPKYHTSSVFLVPLKRSVGSRMDLSTEGAGAIGIECILLSSWMKFYEEARGNCGLYSLQSK